MTSDLQDNFLEDILRSREPIRSGWGAVITVLALPSQLLKYSNKTLARSCIYDLRDTLERPCCDLNPSFVFFPP